MKILIACEESQEVCKAFRKLGHEAYSCDILDCSGGHPEWHIKGDVTELLKQKWDMIIAFPPCTYLSNAGACRLYPQKGVLNKERYEKGLEAKKFFMLFYNADCDKVIVENPISSNCLVITKPCSPKGSLLYPEINSLSSNIAVTFFTSAKSIVGL